MLPTAVATTLDNGRRHGVIILPIAPHQVRTRKQNLTDFSQGSPDKRLQEVVG